MLVPAASAFAENQLTLTVGGSGSGEVSSAEGLHAYPPGVFPSVYIGEPPIECSYASPGPATGTCSNEMEDLEEGLVATALHAIPAEGSEFTGWTISGGQNFGNLFEGCQAEEGEEELNPEMWENCLAYTSASAGEDVTVTATFTAEAPPTPEFALTVAPEGSGSGTVVSNPAGIECGATCTNEFEENTKVTLTASPSAGSAFVSWKGCEKGGVNGRQCTVTMDKAKTVNAKFLTAYDVTVNRVGSGLGKVSSSPGGVLCLSNCSSTTAAFKEGTSVTLTAAATKNYVFTEWTGDCSGSGTCSLGALGADKTVGAKFTPVAQHNLTLTKSGGGNGTVKAKQAGINCGATCSSMAAAYFQGTVVELSATPGKGSAFGGWSGSGCSGTGACTVTMSAAKEVTAEFK